MSGLTGSDRMNAHLAEIKYPCDLCNSRAFKVRQYPDGAILCEACTVDDDVEVAS